MLRGIKIVIHKGFRSGWTRHNQNTFKVSENMSVLQLEKY